VLWQQPGRAKGLLTAAAVMFLGLEGASAQLAITEVMSDPAVTSVEGQIVLNSDWWELTNFGTNAINLTDYYWTENHESFPQFSFQGLEIDPGKCVIILRTNATPDEAAFRAWWGTCLGTSLQAIRSWAQQGLNPDGEFVRLYDSQSNLVDSADFGAAFTGTTFVSDPKTGEFGVYSTLGQCGTCQTATTGDIGSPGTACGPVPLSILVQPTNVLACPGLDAVFSVKAWGLPRPRYQWLFNSNSIPGATSNPLVIADPQSRDEGEYQVVVSNGLEMVLTTKVTLTLNTNPSPPQLLQELSDVEVFVGDPARFSVVAWAVPRPQFQWASNGVDIIDATDRTLVIPNATLELSGTIYSVLIWNTNGWTNTSARLLVQPQSRLEITEAMPAPLNLYDTNCPACKWWAAVLILTCGN
jgi:hypothetical protein